MEKKYRYIVVSKEPKFFAIREGYGDKRADYELLGLSVIDYSRQEITASDIELYQAKGYQFDASGSFIG